MTLQEELLERQRADVFDAFLAGVRRLRWSRERLVTERQRRLQGLLTYSAERSPFWRKRLAGYDLGRFTEEDLRSLPSLTKAELMANFDAAVTVPSLILDRVTAHVAALEGEPVNGDVETRPSDAYLDNEFRVIATSGTSGPRGLFVYGWDDWVTFVVLATRWRGRSGDDPTAPVGTFFASSPMHVSGALHAFSRDFSGGGALPVTHMSAAEPLPEIVRTLNRVRPAILQGYPSILHLLALEALDGQLAVDPTWISTCGEQCPPETRAVARAAWGLEIYDTWGCSEGAYAFPCAQNVGMHLPDDLVIVEPVDKDGRTVPDGELAEKILVTNLYNRTQPLIRYEVPDSMVITTQPCACGCEHSRITDVRGRTDTYFTYGRARVHTLGMLTVILSDPAVAEFHVAQTPRGLLVDVVPHGAVDPGGLGRRLEELLQRSGLADPKVEIRHVDSLARLWSGKVRQFEPLPD